jgi:hypothetical protein
MYWLTIRPNVSPELHAFWASSIKPSAGLLAAVVFSVSVSAWAAWRLMSGHRSPRDWALMICVLPCLLLAGAGAMGWYPVSPRTRLFVLPCFVLAAVMVAEDLLGRYARGTAAGIVAMGVTFGMIAQAIGVQTIEGRSGTEEDYAGAVAFLKAHAAAQDLILVHACCEEGFDLYARLDHWTPPHLAFGDTGYPCCARSKDARPGRSSEAAVKGDLAAKVPRGYSGRVWLLFSTRPTQWDYTGLDEGELWRKILWERGCPPGPFLRFANLAISPMECVSAR